MLALLPVAVCVLNAAAVVFAASEAGVSSVEATRRAEPRPGELLVEDEERVLSENEEDLRLHTLAIQKQLRQQERERRELKEAAEAARAQLSEEELREAEEEAAQTLAGIERAVSVTTSTTRPPGFLKEFGRGLVNFFASPFRSAKLALKNPEEILDTSMGSVSLTKKKVKDAMRHEGKWSDVVRDLWRAYTMDPERMKETKKYAIQEFIDKELPRVALKEGSKEAEELIKLRFQLAEEMSSAFSKAESEDEVQRRFDRLLEKAH